MKILPQILIIFCTVCLWFCSETKPEYPWQSNIDILKSEDQILAYWNEIRRLDQSKRGRSSSDSLDNDNFKKVIYMINNHGYPKRSNIPNMVFTHQSSCGVLENYFPIFHDAYLSGDADTVWFMHNVKGMHRCRFGRDWVQPNQSNYMEVLARLDEKVLSNIRNFDLRNFDLLYDEHIKEVAKIRSGELLNRWENDSNDTLKLYKSHENYFLEKIWRDGSSHFPQKVIVDKRSFSPINYFHSWDGLHFRKDEKNNLYIYKDETVLFEYRIIKNG